MFFATPTLRRTISTPRQMAAQADAALARLLQSAQHSATAQVARGFTATTSEDGSTTLSVDVPGVTRAQLQLRIEGQQVHLRSTDDAPRRVQRSWELPHPIDASASTAKLEHGVLTLVLVPLQPVDTSVSLQIQ